MRVTKYEDDVMIAVLLFRSLNPSIHQNDAKVEEAKCNPKNHSFGCPLRINYIRNNAKILCVVAFYTVRIGNTEFSFSASFFS